MHETVWVDGALAAEKVFDFTGPTGADTVSFTVPNDGAPHQIEANSYSITNGTPITGLPGIVTLTCGSPPPPPPPPPHLRRLHLRLRLHLHLAASTSASASATSATSGSLYLHEGLLSQPLGRDGVGDCRPRWLSAGRLDEPDRRAGSGGAERHVRPAGQRHVHEQPAAQPVAADDRCGAEHGARFQRVVRSSSPRSLPRTLRSR